MLRNVCRETWISCGEEWKRVDEGGECGAKGRGECGKVYRKEESKKKKKKGLSNESE